MQPRPILLALVLAASTLATLAPTASAAPDPDLQCYEIHSQWTVGPLTVTQRSSCDYEASCTGCETTASSAEQCYQYASGPGYGAWLCYDVKGEGTCKVYTKVYSFERFSKNCLVLPDSA